MPDSFSETPPTRHLPASGSSSNEDTRLLGNSTPPPSGSLFGTERPERLGCYRLMKELGRGGMGVVFQATDEHLDRTVALKVISREYAADPSSVMRLREEARAAAQLVHQHIVSVYTFGEDGGLPFIAMEYVEGMDLSEYIAKVGLLDYKQAIAIAIQAAEALSYAEAKNIVHRDIKPSNIFISRGGPAKVMDFGLAKRLDLNTNLTTTGAVVGTPNYMAPEQALGKPVDHRADMYSLGCTIFTMMTGMQPFKAESALQVMMRHINDPLPIPKEWRNIRGGRFLAVLDKMTAKQPEERYQTWPEAIQALRGVDSDLPAAVPQRKQPKRGMLVVTAVLAAALCAGVAIAVVMSKSSDPEPELYNAAVAPISQSFTPTPTATPVPAEAGPATRVEELREEVATTVLTAQDELLQAGIGYERVLELAREGQFEQARLVLDTRKAPEMGGPIARLAFERVDNLLDDVEVALTACVQYERILFGATAPQGLTSQQRGEAALRRAESITAPEQAQEIFQAMVYLHAIGDPRHAQADQLLRHRFPEFHPSAVQRRLMEATHRFFGGVEGEPPRPQPGHQPMRQPPPPRRGPPPRQ